MANTPETSTPAPAPLPGAHGERPALIERLEKHRRLISYVLGGVALVAVATWLYAISARNKEAMALNALEGARAAYEQGNLPAASTEFQRVIQSYAGTDAAHEAVLGLNSVRLASGQAQLAADELRQYTESGPPAEFATGAWLMLGAALENLAKYADAAQAYQRAGETAPEDYRKVEGLLGASRSHILAGNQQQGLDLLRGIVSRYDLEIPGVAEAKVRLSELTRGAM